MSNLKVSKYSKNKQIYPWPEKNFMVWDRMMMNAKPKWVINLECEKSQPDKNINPSPIKYKAHQVNKIFLDKYNKIFLMDMIKLKNKADG